jgi:hypothetical protein
VPREMGLPDDRVERLARSREITMLDGVAEDVEGAEEGEVGGQEGGSDEEVVAAQDGWEGDGRVGRVGRWGIEGHRTSDGE